MGFQISSFNEWPLTFDKRAVNWKSFILSMSDYFVIAQIELNWKMLLGVINIFFDLAILIHIVCFATFQ